MTGYLLMGIMIALTTVGQLLSKKGAEKVVINKQIAASVRSLFNPYLVLAALAIGAAPAFYIMALKEIDLSVAFALTGLNYILVGLGGKIVFKERLNLFHYFGMISIFAGILIFHI
jgi:multidrug transporter EmrE-like cation transporter